MSTMENRTDKHLMIKWS